MTKADSFYARGYGLRRRVLDYLNSNAPKSKLRSDFNDWESASGTRFAESPADLERSSTSWHEYYLGFAEHAASKSKDSTKVGAVIVGPDGEIRMTGFNGPPRGVRDIPERFERPAKYLYASHAERNAISFAARAGVATDGCSMYVTHSPCGECMKSIIQAGIRCVYVGDGKTVMPIEPHSQEMADEAGVKVVQL